MKKLIFFILIFSLFTPSLLTAAPTYQQQLNRGLRNSDAYSYVLIQRAQTDKANTRSILKEALEYSPDLPAVYFELAKASFGFKPEKIFESIDYMVQGIASYQRNFWWSFMMIALLTISLILSFILAILIIVFIRFSKDVSLLAHDIAEEKSRVLLLLLLLLAAFGPLYLLGGGLIITSLYLKKWNKYIVYLFLLFLLASPFISRLISMFLIAPASGELKAVVQVNESRGNTYALSVLKNRNHPVELFSYALALKREGRFHEAIDIYQKLLAIRPDYRLYINIANCYAALNDLENAKKSYKKSIELKPSASALYNLSQVYRESLDFEQGEEYFFAAQRLDNKAVLNFRALFRRNPNRFVIDEVLPVSVILDYAKTKTFKPVSAAGLSFVPQILMPFLAILMAVLFFMLDRNLKSRAHRCNRCGKILCDTREKHLFWGNMCSQCYQSLVKLDELDAKERIAKILTVYEYRKKKRNIIKILSLLLPGTGQIFARNVIHGMFFLWSFLFFILMPIMNYLFIKETSYFSHLWITFFSIFFAALVYVTSNIITRRRLSRGWL